MTGNQFRFPANTTPTRQATAVTTYASSASPTPPTRSRPAGPAPSRCFSSNGTATHAPQPSPTSASSTAPDTPTTPAPDVNSAGTAPAAYAPLNSSDCNPNNTMLLAPQDQDFDLSPVVQCVVDQRQCGADGHVRPVGLHYPRVSGV